jgi:hypothetical protein
MKKTKELLGGCGSLLKKHKVWLLRVALPAVIVGVVVVVVNLLINGHFLSNYHNEAKYQIGGEVAWVGGREWAIYDPESNATLGASNTDGEFTVTDLAATSKIAIYHPDWTVRFLVLNSAAAKCQTTDFKKNLDDCAAKNETELVLNHKLDKFMQEWSNNVINRKWDKMSATTDYDDDEMTLGETLNAWSEGLIEKNYAVKQADVYIDLTAEKTDASEVAAFVVWQLVNSETGGTKIISTDVNLTVSGGEYRWKFNQAALPRI